MTLEFVPLKSDTYIYICRKNGVVITLTPHVDDLLLVGADIQVIESIKRKMMERFKIKTWETFYSFLVYRLRATARTKH